MPGLFARLYRRGLLTQFVIHERQSATAQERDRAEEQLRTEEELLREANASLSVIKANQHAELEERRAIAEQERNEAQARLNLLLAGNRPEAIRRVQADIAALEAKRAHLADRKKRLEIVSPIAGTVVTHRPQDLIGRQTEEIEKLIEVQDVWRLDIEIAIPEKEAGEIGEAMPLFVKTLAFPDRLIESKVHRISPIAREVEALDESRQEIFKVDASIRTPSQWLKPGMTGKAKISCGRSSLWSVMTRRLSRQIKVEFWSLW